MVDKLDVSPREQRNVVEADDAGDPVLGDEVDDEVAAAVVLARSLGAETVAGAQHPSAIISYTGWMEWMSHRKRRETKQQPGTARPGKILGCCLVYLFFLCHIHSIHSGIISHRF